MSTDKKTYRVADPNTLFVSGQRVENGVVKLTPEQARYDLLSGVLVEEQAPARGSKAAKTPVEG